MLMKNIRKIYTFPKTVQWIIAIVLSVTGILFSLLLLSLIYFPLWLVIIPIVKTISHFAISPLLRLSGLLNYYSPMLLVIKSKTQEWELHNGTTFDYILNMKWKQRGRNASKFIMINYLNGLLKIINEIEEKKSKDEITILGISYIINKKTAERLGFTVEKPSIFRRILFLIDYFTLFLMYSFSQGKVAFPNILKVKKMKISGSKLVASKQQIIRTLALVSNKTKFAGNII